MIVFLTLIYVAVLFLAIKIGLIKLNTFWKLSPAIWMVLLFFVLFVPMQWGAPSGAVNQFQTVIEIIPNVNGEVTEVEVQALESVKQGEVLFRIDPTQYQSRVRHVRPGQEVEVALRLIPGKILKGSVLEVVRINPSAQLPPSGMVPPAPTPADPTLPYAVGTAAIYTDSVAPTHIIRRVMIRMEAWLNYIKP